MPEVTMKDSEDRSVLNHDGRTSTEEDSKNDNPQSVDPLLPSTDVPKIGLSSIRSFIQKYKVGPLYIPEIFSSCTTTGKLIFVSRMILAFIQVSIGFMTLYATKDDDPSYYLLLVGMFTSTYTMTLVLFPFYYTTSEESHNIQLLAEVEKCKTHLQSVIDACYFIPFALGLTFLYGGLPCEQQLVFGTTAMFVVFHLIYTCLPVFLVLLAVIFFPVTYWYFRKLGLEAEAEEKLAKQKASDDLINEFPIFKFQTKTEDDDIEMVEKSQFLSQRKSEKQPMLEPSPAPTFVNDKVTADTPCLELDADDASCTVCLGQYEDGVHLRQLGCKHHFHKDCIDEWLRLNGKCPLCIQGLEEIPYEE